MYASGPVRKIRKRLRERGIEVYDINEDYTSQLNNVCYKKFDAEKNEIYAVRCCTTTNCSHNGSEVIRDVIIFMMFSLRIVKIHQPDD